MDNEILNSTDGEENEKSKIVNAAMFIDALKSSGYKSTYNAIAEIVDNSIDADADNIFVIGEQIVAGNGGKRIVGFAFLDDGKGMDYETLKGCLTIGYTTNQKRKGMGRFGVGLPQASIFVCNCVEVYSWQNGIENCCKVHLDAEEVRTNNLNEIADPVPADIPECYKKFIKWNGEEKSFDFSRHGTLVVWSKCTTVDEKKWKTCVSHMSEDLGRKYRYFLQDQSKHIRMIELTSSQEEIMYPNDPLYLMKPSQECVPDNIETFKQNHYESRIYNPETGYTSSLFEKYGEDVILPIKYEENGELKTGNVTIKYSVVKKEYYSKTTLNTETKPGSLPYGKSTRLQNNTGISIVRNGREIDFGSFGFFSSYNVPDYRWWGVEISFKSDLDSAFGISNNKQYVNLKPMSKQEMADILDDEIRTVWHQLAVEILPTIEEMAKRNSKIRGEEMIVDTTELSESSEVATAADMTIDPEPTGEVSVEVQEVEAKEQLVKEGNEFPTEAQIQKLIDSKVRVVTVHNKGKNDSFVDYSFAAGTLSIVLNANHVFYQKLVKNILEDDDKKTAFELFLIAVMKSIKDLNLEYSNAMDKLTYKINDRITRYMMDLSKKDE